MLSNTHFAMAVHVLSALAYNEGELLASEKLAHSMGTNPSFLRGLGTADEEIVHTTWSEIDRAIEADHLTSLYVPDFRAGPGTGGQVGAVHQPQIGLVHRAVACKVCPGFSWASLAAASHLLGSLPPAAADAAHGDWDAPLLALGLMGELLLPLYAGRLMLGLGLVGLLDFLLSGSLNRDVELGLGRFERLLRLLNGGRSLGFGDPCAGLELLELELRSRDRRLRRALRSTKP